MVNNDLRAFQLDWDEKMAAVRSVPDYEWLEPIYRNQVEFHPGLKPYLQNYEMLPSGHKDRTYPNLREIVVQYLELKRRHATSFQPQG